MTASGGFGRLVELKQAWSWGPPPGEVLCPKPFCQSGCSWSRSGPGYVPVGELCPKAALAWLLESRGDPQMTLLVFLSFWKGSQQFSLCLSEASGLVNGFYFCIVSLTFKLPLFSCVPGQVNLRWAPSNISPCCRLPGWWGWGSCGILCLHLSCLFLCGPSMCSNCSFRPQVFFQGRNHSVCKYRFDVFMGGGELRVSFQPPSWTQFELL